MDWNDDPIVVREKTKLFTKIGCFFGIVIIGPLVIILLAWSFFHTFFPTEKELLISHSPNQINKIEIVQIEEFPDPILRIKYDDKFITKTKLPDDITVEWAHDYEANVILTKHGRKPDIVSVEFN